MPHATPIRSMAQSFLHDGIQLSHDSNDPSRERHDALHGRGLFRFERWLQAEQLRFSQQCRQRIVELVLDEGSQPLQIGATISFRKRGRPGYGVRHGLTPAVAIT